MWSFGKAKRWAEKAGAEGGGAEGAAEQRWGSPSAQCKKLETAFQASFSSSL